MKTFYRILWLACLLLIGMMLRSAQATALADTIPPDGMRMVDFEVDVLALQNSGFIDPNIDRMFIRGDFSNWNAVPMPRSGPYHFRTSVPVMGPQGADLQYKFYYERMTGPVYNGGWELMDPAQPELNRILTLGPPDMGIAVIASFNYIPAEPPPAGNRPVTFSVDVSSLVALGLFDVAVDDYVAVTGGFSGWETLPLMRTGPTTWAATIDVAGAEMDVLEYKFYYERVVGDRFNAGYEIIDVREITESRYINRILTLGPPDVPMILDMASFGVEQHDPGTIPIVTVLQLNTYPRLENYGDLATHPMMGQEVRFTAVVSGMPLNSGLAGMTMLQGVPFPQRLHVFVVDTSATSSGRAGMGMQIAELMQDPAMMDLLNARRGDIMTFTGMLTLFSGYQIQFDLTQVPVRVGNVFEDAAYQHHLPLLEPMQTGTYLLNELTPEGYRIMNIPMYTVFAHQYVELGGRFQRYSQEGMIRPTWSLSSDGGIVGLADMSLRYRSDRNTTYPAYMNYRRIETEGFFTPPNDVNGRVRGFVSYGTREPDGSMGMQPTAVVNPWYDGVVWSDGIRYEVDWLPRDLTVTQDTVVVPPDVRTIRFTVDMMPLVHNGLFDPAQDRVFVRGNFTIWNPVRMPFLAGTTFQVELPVAGLAGDPIEYKFYYESDRIAPYNSGWELLDAVNYELNRTATLGPVDQPQSMPPVMFGYIPIAPPTALPVYLYTTTRFAPGDADGNWLYIGLGADDTPAENLIGMGFRLRFDTTLVVPTAYTTLGMFDDGIDQAYLDLFELMPDGAAMSIVRTEGTNKNTYGPVFGVRFLVKEGVESFNVWIDEVEIRDDQGLIVPFNLMNGSIAIPTRTMEVWPGDTNADAIVDVFDVEPIAFHFGMMGPGRDNRQIQWVAYEAPLWDVREMAHVDANGDGHINQNDLLPVGFNYGKTVGMMAKEADILPSLGRPEAVRYALPSMSEGERFEVPVFVDPTMTGAVDLRSVAFQIETDFESVAIESAVPSAWFDGNGMLRMTRVQAEENRYSAAFSRTRAMGAASGNGAAVVLTLVAKTNLAPGTALLTVTRSQVGLGVNRSLPSRLYVPDGTITSIGDGDGETRPTATRLDANIPNPFNPSTLIGYRLSENGRVRLTVYDILGREIAVLVDGDMPAGAHQVRFDASGLSSGLYLYRLQTVSTTLTRTMTLVK